MSARTRRIYADLASPFDEPDELDESEDEPDEDELDESEDDEDEEDELEVSFAFSVAFSRVRLELRLSVL
jgi:hypothetical protein